MKVNSDLPPIDKLRKLIDKQNGVIFTSDLSDLGIARAYLSILVKKGEIQKVSRGIYSKTNTIVDEMVCIQARFNNAIFSHGTALYLLDLTDRTPLSFSVTVPSGYNASNIKTRGIKVFFVKNELFELGSVNKNSPHGNEVKTYNLERTICDILRNRNRIDSQIINSALKRYVIRKERDLHQLYHYAEIFHVQNLVRNSIEILL